MESDEIAMGEIGVEIRKAVFEDLDEIVEIEETCFPLAEAASKQTFSERLHIYAHHFLVAQVDGTLVGFVNGLLSNESRISDEMFEDASLHIKKGKYQMIFGLDVIKEYRGIGIAHRLMQAIIEKSRNEGRRGVILTCKDELIGFYETLGFVNKDRSKSVHGGAVWYDMELIF